MYGYLPVYNLSVPYSPHRRSLTQALQSPINWNFNDYNGGDTVEENHIQLEMNRCELTPNDMASSDNDDILSTTNSTVSRVLL